jgi:6-phosphofructokinase
LKRIGVLTGGGDAPGLDAAIRAIVRRGIGQFREGWIDAVRRTVDDLRLDGLIAIRSEGMVPAGARATREGVPAVGGPTTIDRHVGNRRVHRLSDRRPGRDGRDRSSPVLGHVQRGGSPIAEDRILATRLGSVAIGMAERGPWAAMAASQARIVEVPLDRRARPPRPRRPVRPRGGFFE